MHTNEIERLRSIRTFPSLVKYLRDDLDWPIESEDFDELTFDYEPKELGLDSKIAVKIGEIKQLRPLTSPQPWGIFFIKFAPKRLPVVALRRALQSLVTKRRESANKADLKTWHKSDLLFISSYGEDGERAITFAHFAENKETGGSPILRVLGWDKLDAPLHIADAHDQLKEKLHWPDDEENLEQWRKTWASAFILRHREVVDTSKKLATRLADLASTIRSRVNQVLAVEDPEKGPMRQLYKAFQEILIHDLSEDDFADTYAQTITYGLLAAAIEQHEPDKKMALIVENIADMIPATNPFLKKLLGKFITISGRKKKLDFDELGINEVVDLLNNANLTAVLHDIGRLAQRDDPVYYFYEDFMHEYDAKKRKKRGIYFTPPPVVSFIVRSVDEILRKDFGLENGLADTTTWGEMAKRNKDVKIPQGVSENEPFVQILDPGTGTGTFLVEVIDLIHKTMIKKWKEEGHMPLEFDKLWNEYVPKHLLPRLYGFEIMMAPYTIAHMKIGLKLKETRYKFGVEERLRVYLTNTLEEPKDISGYFEQMAPALAYEAHSCNEIKQNLAATVIIGNPPYSKISLNMRKWATEILKANQINGVRLQSYYVVDGKPLGERKVWLQDDYVKFIRVAQYYIARSGYGLLGYITNHGFLGNPTFNGMRQSLIKTFNSMNLFNLHGDSNVGENLPEGVEDQNVFDIQQGVAISIMQLGINPPSFAAHYADIWGTRVEKYDKLSKQDSCGLKTINLAPDSPLYLLLPTDSSLRSEFEAWPLLSDIMPYSTSGIVTSKDNLVIGFTDREIRKRIDYFLDETVSDAEVKKRLKLSENYAWRISTARETLRSDKSWDKRFRIVYYRPFDTRHILFHPAVVWRTREEKMQPMLVMKNIGLLATRQASKKFTHILCSRFPIEMKACSHDRNTELFPLWLVDAGLQIENESEHRVVPNFSDIFLEMLQSVIGSKKIDPEVGFYYIYAVVHSNDYRSRYWELLKRSYPRVPITTKKDLFNKLCDFGGELVSLHLMESDELNHHMTLFPVQGNNAITKVGEKGKKLADIKDGRGRLFINRTQYFDGLPEKVWNFQIGGYQVCHKWLADRKKAGRKLSADDLEHYHKIVVAINETIKIMKQIDETIDAHGGWPIK